MWVLEILLSFLFIFLAECKLYVEFAMLSNMVQYTQYMRNKYLHNGQINWKTTLFINTTTSLPIEVFLVRPSADTTEWIWD